MQQIVHHNFSLLCSQIAVGVLITFFFPHLPGSKPDFAGFKPLAPAAALDTAETQPMDESQIAAAAATAFSLAMPLTGDVPSAVPLNHENPPGLEVPPRLVLLMGQVAYILLLKNDRCPLVTLPTLGLKSTHLICISNDAGPCELNA